MFFVNANLAKTMFATESATGLVERKNARQQFPQPQPFRLGNESSDQRITDASTSPVPPDVHRKFANPPITFPIPVRSSTGPAYNSAIDLRNNSGITTSDGLKPGLLILRRTQPGFIGGDAVLDALIINFSNRRRIIFAGGPNQYAIHVWTLRPRLGGFR